MQHKRCPLIRIEPGHGPIKRRRQLPDKDTVLDGCPSVHHLGKLSRIRWQVTTLPDQRNRIPVSDAIQPACH